MRGTADDGREGIDRVSIEAALLAKGIQMASLGWPRYRCLAIRYGADFHHVTHGHQSLVAKVRGEKFSLL